MFKVNVRDFDVDHCVCSDTCCQEQVNHSPVTPLNPSSLLRLFQQLLQFRISVRFLESFIFFYQGQRVGFHVLLLKAIAKEDESSPQTCVDCGHSVPSVHQLTDEVLNQLLIDFIHKLDLRHGIEEEL